ncbi:hypothetical protein MPSEU_000351000 [Mayamaea pseudoterrestris]|nr:hypothetical protein MPSEU_000351000 [Mayamaea pseudoterrestris]
MSKRLSAAIVALLYCTAAVDAFTFPLAARCRQTCHIGFPKNHAASYRLTSRIRVTPSSDEKGSSRGAASTDDGTNDATTTQRTPFLARIKEVFQRNKNNNDENEEANEKGEITTSLQAAATSTASSSSASSLSASSSATPPINESPSDQASRFRAQADKMRLEADRLDAELTLRKIDKLERDIVAAQKLSGEEDGKTKQKLEQLVAEMDMLQRKLLGEPQSVASTKSPAAASNQSRKSTPLTKPATTESNISKKSKISFEPMVKVAFPNPEGMDIDTIAEELEKIPGFALKSMASFVDLDYDSAEDIDKRELAKRMDQMRRNDFSFIDKPPPPPFSSRQIEERAKEIREGSMEAKLYPWDMMVSSLEIDETANGVQRNETELAIQSLQYEYYIGDQNIDIDKIISDEEWLQPVIAALNKTAIDAALETLYPVCTRKPDNIPTDAQIQQLASAVLPKAGFASTSKPERVSGGFIIRGKSKLENGNKLIDAIDAEMAKTSLANKLTVVYTPDHSAFVDDEAMEQMMSTDEIPSILYVLGPDIVREQRRVALSTTSALGLATAWYLSIYPYLLNTGLSKRIEEDLALVDSGMSPDLAWLTDLSIPLFAIFFGIQVLHELGHRAAAAANGVKLTFPAFVPSIITGITSTVTSFKSPPKNKDAMFDVAVAGPLTGMIASIAAIALGASLTLSSDPSLLPALPLQILRQSTLGGGLIESVLGAGVLAVPSGAENSAQIAAITIPLHPLAVAGYISLIVNALSLVPVGTTDGGRVALTLFGRGAKLLIGNVFLTALFCIGASGSDLFLFYFGFVLAFQTGNEIPSRNEVDPLSFERVLVATAGIVLMLLTLIPFQ